MKVKDIKKHMAVRKVREYSKDYDYAFGEPTENTINYISKTSGIVTKINRRLSYDTNTTITRVLVDYPNGDTLSFHPRELDYQTIDFNEVM